jgi:FKBP-type peptidyl-prolyl cis-trans isomerase (trigger factor)
MTDTHHNVADIYTGLTVKELPGSEIEITAEIPVALAHHHRVRALKKVQKNLELPGFRKGHVPEDMALAHIGDATLMQETAEMAISEAYAAIVEEKKLDVVGRPSVTITKLAPGNPIGFKITSAVYPKIDLPDYKKISAETVTQQEDPDKAEVTEAELAAELERLQNMFAPHVQAGDSAGEGEVKKPELPELNDDFARQLGDFKDLADLKEKVKQGYAISKKQKLLEKRRLAIADAILGKTHTVVPNVFIEGEIDQMVGSFEERVTRAGMKMDDYLKQVNKTLEDLRKEWQPDAEKRAKLQLVFNEIAKKENIVPDVAKLDREVAHIKEHYPDAHEHSIRVYAASQMTNELIFRFLEGKEASGAEETEHDHHGHDHS